MSAPEGRMYHDSDGNECTLPVLCLREPEWAANVIARLREEADADKSAIHELKKTLSLVENQRDLAQSQLAELVGILPRCQSVDLDGHSICSGVATRASTAPAYYAVCCDKCSRPDAGWRDLPYAPLIRALSVGRLGEAIAVGDKVQNRNTRFVATVTATVPGYMDVLFGDGVSTERWPIGDCMLCSRAFAAGGKDK